MWPDKNQTDVFFFLFTLGHVPQFFEDERLFAAIWSEESGSRLSLVGLPCGGAPRDETSVRVEGEGEGYCAGACLYLKGWVFLGRVSSSPLRSTRYHPRPRKARATSSPRCIKIKKADRFSACVCVRLGASTISHCFHFGGTGTMLQNKMKAVSHLLAIPCR